MHLCELRQLHLFSESWVESFRNLYRSATPDCSASPVRYTTRFLALEYDGHSVFTFGQLSFRARNFRQSAGALVAHWPSAFHRLV